MSTHIDTPRTDAAEFDAYTWEGDGYTKGDYYHEGKAVPSEVARRLEREVIALQDWKDSALAVARELDAQRIAKLLGGRPGESCYKVINEKVPELRAERDCLMLALHGCYAATGEEAGDIDDFRALVNREAVVIDAIQQLRIDAQNWEAVAEFRGDSLTLVERENARLREALEWYAEFATTTEINHDCGKRARQALDHQANQ